MKSYVSSSLGVDTPVPATEPTQSVEPVGTRTPNFTQQTFALMGVAALPWVPVFAGAWIGDKYDRKGWGALAGFALSFLVIRKIAKDMAGNIT